MSSEEIRYWLEVVAEWQKQQLDPNTNTLVQQIECLGELNDFLSRLEGSLVRIGGIDEALSQLPRVGQLLGRLTTIVPMVCDVKSYKTLMACLMFFYVDEPATPVEAKAKAWAVSQVRSTVSASKINTTTSLQTAPGYSQLQINSECLRKVARQINEHLRSGLRSVPRDELHNITRICLGLIHIPYFSNLLQNIITALGENGKHHEVILEFINDFSDPSDAVENVQSATSLPYACQFALWRSYLPSLEQSSLKLCVSCLDQTSTTLTDLEDKVTTSLLVQASSDDIVVYETVLSILEQLKSEADDKDTYSQIIHILQNSVKNHRHLNS